MFNTEVELLPYLDICYYLSQIVSDILCPVNCVTINRIVVDCCRHLYPYVMLRIRHPMLQETSTNVAIIVSLCFIVNVARNMAAMLGWETWLLLRMEWKRGRRSELVSCIEICPKGYIYKRRPQTLD